jgi:hypothetical protein
MHLCLKVNMIFLALIDHVIYFFILLSCYLLVFIVCIVV